MLNIPRLSCQIAERTIAWKLGTSQSGALQFGNDENDINYCATETDDRQLYGKIREAKGESGRFGPLRPFVSLLLLLWFRLM